MKTRIDNTQQINKHLVAIILELQTELTLLKKRSRTYNQDLNTYVQTLIDSMDILLERIVDDI